MATITIGRLTEFDPKIDTITAYMERVTLYFQVEQRGRRKTGRRALSALGPKTCMLC